MKVTSTARGVYMVHEEGQRPVEGVAVFYYDDFDAWRCECTNPFSITTRPDCEHIALAKEREKENG